MESYYTLKQISEMTGLEYGTVLMLVKNKTIGSVDTYEGKRGSDSQLKEYLERGKNDNSTTKIP